MSIHRLLPLALLLTACPQAPQGPPEPAAPQDTTPAKTADAESTKSAHGDHDGAEAIAFKPLPEARVHFVEPADGATVSSPVKLVFGVEGATIKPAGTMEPGTGHHHVIINGEPGPEGEVVPADETHIHYGKGQTEAELELPKGEHKLTMQLADGLHRSFGPSASATITVTVE